MRPRHGASMLTSVVWDSLAGIFILSPFPAVTQADPNPGLFLGPDQPNECDTLMVKWHPAKQNPPFYNVKIVDKSSSQTIFKTNVTGPTNSVTWVVAATEGASLHLAIHTPPELTTSHYAATSFQVHLGPSTCFSASATVTPTSTATMPSPTTPSTTSLSAPSSTTPSAPASTTTSSSNTPEPTAKSQSRSLSSTGHSDSSSESTHIFPSLSLSSTLNTSSSPLPVEAAPSDSHDPPRALNSGAIAGIVIGSLLGIALAIVAFYLLWRRARPRTAAKQSSFTSHVGWLPRISRSRYPARDSLSSDSYLSEVESVKPIAAWKPELFVREKPEAGYAASRLPLVQHPSLPSGTPETVPSAEERRA